MQKDKREQVNIVIIGGGLTGLTLQYLLRKEGIQAIILEARSRLGGRIYTPQPDNAPPIEMGATWLDAQHTYLNDLLKELGLEVFPQKLGKTAIYESISTSPHQLVTLPHQEIPSYRIKGGTSSLIHALSKDANRETLYYNQAVHSIKEVEGNLVVESNDHTFSANIVVSTLPPFLFKNTIKVTPNLPNSILEVMSKTHTWMGESIKVGLSYKSPFWREPKMSGTVFSNVGPMSELYDHSNDVDDLYALKGFLNGNYHSVNKEDRLNMVLNQLRKYYGKIVDEYVTYEELVWQAEKYTYTKYEGYIIPHQNNGHQLYQQAYLQGKLYIAGAETAASAPGYMEGAICSANHVCNQIKNANESA